LASLICRRFHSSESTLLVVYSDIVQASDAGHVVPLTLLDLSSSFDAVDHSILLSTLQSRFSVSGHPLEWFRSYLSDRTQVFVAQSRETPPISLTSGVPQNCSLGPPQFISCTECSADIFSMHGVQYQLCADDTQSYDHCPVTIACNQCTMLTRLSSCINDLAASLRLKLNPTKLEST